MVKSPKMLGFDRKQYMDMSQGNAFYPNTERDNMKSTMNVLKQKGNAVTVPLNLPSLTS